MIAEPFRIRPTPPVEARRDFRVRRPETLDNLATRIPDDVDVSRLRIVWWYNETPPGGKEAGHKEHVPCSCCKQRKLHWIGCVVQLPDGRYALIGNKCGIRELGPAYQLMRNAFKVATFCADANIHRVAAWAKQVEAIERKIGQTIVADGAALCDADAGTRLELPQTCRWPELPELSALRRSMDATDDERDLAR